MTRTQMLRASWNGWMSQSVTPAGPVWLQHAWPLVFSMIVAVCFTIAGFLMFGERNHWNTLADWAGEYLGYLVFSIAVAYSIHGLFWLGRRLVGPARMQRLTSLQRWFFYLGIPVVGVVLGNVIGNALLSSHYRFWGTSGEPGSVLGTVLFALLSFFLFAVYFSARTQKILAERRATQAQLRLLQAQMEPHFLFNTLANVVGLMEADTPRAKAMLESFTDYLRASLLSLREPEHSLGDELKVVDAYLRVVAVRMDDRLRYRIDVPAELLGQRVPALSLQPLIENAIVHGLEPSIAGGEVLISARRQGDDLVLQVSDDGIGLDAPRSARAGAGTSTGTALNNIRERLRQTHGERARLTIAPAAPHGVCATLSLPCGKTPCPLP